MRVSTEFESFGALYEELEEEELGLDLAPLFSPRQSLGRRFGRREWLEFEESSAAPVFDIECAPCPVKDCRPLLRQAIVEAIRLAKRAADKLEAASKLAPNDRDPAAQKTAQLFMASFCHDPSLPIPWAGNEASGLSIAKRLRLVARELGGGRRIQFVCLPTVSPCTTASCCPDDIARARQGEPVILCEEFWKDSDLEGLPTVDRRSGVLIHEMLHFLFASTTRERGIVDMGPKRAVADCYEAFVLRVNGFVTLGGKCKKCK